MSLRGKLPKRSFLLRLFCRTLGLFHNKPGFYFLTGPRCFPKKGKTRFHARIVKKATYGNTRSHLGPAMAFHQLFHDRLERNSVERVPRMKSGRWHILFMLIESRMMVKTRSKRGFCPETPAFSNPVLQAEDFCPTRFAQPF